MAVKKKNKAKKVVHLALDEEVYDHYVEEAQKDNRPLSTYLILILLQNRRTPLKCQAGLRKAG